MEIDRESLTVRLESTGPIGLPEGASLRFFNNVPAFAAIPLTLPLSAGRESRLRIFVRHSHGA